MKDVQCYELFGGIALKNHTFNFFISSFLLQLTFMLSSSTSSMFSTPSLSSFDFQEETVITHTVGHVLSITLLAHSLSFSCTPHIDFTTDISVLRKTPVSLSLRHLALLPYRIVGFT